MVIPKNEVDFKKTSLPLSWKIIVSFATEQDNAMPVRDLGC